MKKYRLPYFIESIVVVLLLLLIIRSVCPEKVEELKKLPAFKLDESIPEIELSKLNTPATNNNPFLHIIGGIGDNWRLLSENSGYFCFAVRTRGSSSNDYVHRIAVITKKCEGKSIRFCKDPLQGVETIIAVGGNFVVLTTDPNSEESNLSGAFMVFPDSCRVVKCNWFPEKLIGMPMADNSNVNHEIRASENIKFLLGDLMRYWELENGYWGLTEWEVEAGQFALKHLVIKALKQYHFDALMTGFNFFNRFIKFVFNPCIYNSNTILHKIWFFSRFKFLKSNM